MKSNIGLGDRVFRISVGIGILSLITLETSEWRFLALLGFVPLATGMVGSCPIYSLVGFDTLTTKRARRRR